MKVAGDLAPLDLRRLQGSSGQRLPLAHAVAEPAGERVGERDLDELEHDEAAEGDRGEAAPELGAGGADRLVAVVRLEQQRVVRVVPDGEVHLEQLAVLALEAVLGLGEVADLGLDPARAHGVELVVTELVRRADQLRSVGVHDAPVGVPQLDPHHLVVEHLLAHDVVDARRAPPGRHVAPLR